MKKLIFGLLIVMMVLITLVRPAPVVAKATQTSFTAVEYICHKTGGKVWIEGDILYIKNAINENVVYKDGEIWGITTATLSASANLLTGELVSHGSYQFQPVGVDGYWDGIGNWKGTFAGVTGKGVTHRRGSLNGLVMFTDMVSIERDPTAPDPCPGHGVPGGVTYWDGYILDPGK